MTTKSVYVYVDVDLDEFDDDEIIEEYEKRGLGFASGDEIRENILEMYYAFYLGKPERAIELAKKVAQDVTGRTLP